MNGKRRTAEDFINDSQLIHGDKYEYSKSIFTIKFQRKPTYFSRWMNLVNNFLLGICICRNNIVYL